MEHPAAMNEAGGIQERKEEVELEIRPLQMLRSRMFYCIWMLFLLGGLGGVFLVSQYKVRVVPVLSVQGNGCSWSPSTR